MMKGLKGHKGHKGQVPIFWPIPWGLYVPFVPENR